jgi:hypothetical protein
MLLLFRPRDSGVVVVPPPPTPTTFSEDEQLLFVDKGWGYQDHGLHRW